MQQRPPYLPDLRSNGFLLKDGVFEARVMANMTGKVKRET